MPLLRFCLPLVWFHNHRHALLPDLIPLRLYLPHALLHHLPLPYAAFLPFNWRRLPPGRRKRGASLPFPLSLPGAFYYRFVLYHHLLRSLTYYWLWRLAFPVPEKAGLWTRGLPDVMLKEGCATLKKAYTPVPHLLPPATVCPYCHVLDSGSSANPAFYHLPACRDCYAPFPHHTTFGSAVPVPVFAYFTGLTTFPTTMPSTTFQFVVKYLLPATVHFKQPSCRLASCLPHC